MKHVALVVLAREQKRNALTPDMLAQLRAAIRSTAAAGEAQEPARALVLAGDGPVFCGGFDLKLCVAQEGTLAALLQGLHETIVELKSLAVPVVIAAHGAAIAGGCALLGGGDVVITNADARLGDPVTPLGISPAISAPFLRLLAGDGPARERLLDPDLITGCEALRLGLVHECVAEAARVRTRALELAAALADKPKEAITATRRWLQEIEQQMTVPDQARGLRASMALVGSDEERERLKRLLRA
jgi:methylglutaconyl-CoA hydratase